MKDLAVVADEHDAVAGVDARRAEVALFNPHVGGTELVVDVDVDVDDVGHVFV